MITVINYQVPQGERALRCGLQPRRGEREGVNTKRQFISQNDLQMGWAPCGM